MLANAMQVRYTEEAALALEHLLDALEANYSIAVADRLELALMERLESLAVFPYQYPAFLSESYGEVHKMVVLSNTIVLYRVDLEGVTILTVVDARTNWK